MSRPTVYRPPRPPVMHNRIADPETPVDVAARRLHPAGWTIGDVAGSAG
jgi:hypothetical protein